MAIKDHVRCRYIAASGQQRELSSPTLDRLLARFLKLRWATLLAVWEHGHTYTPAELERHGWPKERL